MNIICQLIQGKPIHTIFADISYCQGDFRRIAAGLADLFPQKLQIFKMIIGKVLKKFPPLHLFHTLFEYLQFADMALVAYSIGAESSQIDVKTTDLGLCGKSIADAFQLSEIFAAVRGIKQCKQKWVTGQSLYIFL